METMAFLGCSRGLGRSVVKKMKEAGALEKALLFSRSQDSLESLVAEIEVPCQSEPVDFAKPDSLEAVFSILNKERPKRLFYFAGGGPYGSFGSKNWKDHQWAFQVSFLTPAQLLHRYLESDEWKFIEQIVFIGSLIADSQADPMAASYTASKHGLRGLVESVSLEYPDLDVRLYRPGYMNTGMLPKNATPRTQGKNLAEPEDVAERLVTWALDSQGNKIQSDL